MTTAFTIATLENIYNTVTITTTTNSTSTTTGALIVTGGVGIGGNLNVGGGLKTSGALTATNITNSSLTANQILYAGTGGLETGSSTFVYSGGSVGIGTNNPQQLLDVYKATNDTVIRVQTASAGAYFYADSAGTDGFYGLAMFNNGTEKAFIGSYGTGAGVIQFKQTRSGTEYGRFNASGYLGIGTTSPNTTLEVSSSTQTGFTFQRISNTFGSTTNNGAGTALQFYGWDAGITANIKSIRTQQAYSPSALTFETFGGNGNTGNNTLAERMRIDDYGRVGIGTTNPGRQLEVWGAAGASNGEVDIKLYDTTSATQIQLMKTGGTYSYVGIGASEGALYNYGSNLTLAVDGAYAMKFAVNGSERARISSSGYFGIGTTAPGYLLEIGTTGSSNQYTQVLRNNGSQNLELLFAASGKQTRHIGTLVSSDSFFIGRDSSVYDLVINSSGQVGIGTSSPSTPLQVNGIITSSGHSITPYAQATVTGSYTATNWYSVFANGLGLNAIATTGGVGNLTTPGTYIIYAYISTFQASGQMYWMQFSSVPFYWQGNGYTSNSGATYTFPALIGTGLSPNSEVVQLRTRMTYQSVDGGTYIDWSSNFSWSGLDGSSSGKTVIFNMVRIT